MEYADLRRPQSTNWSDRWCPFPYKNGMRQMAGSVLLASVAALMAVPLADAEERTIRLTEEEKQELREANERLLPLTFRFLYDSWPCLLYTSPSPRDRG